MTRQGLLLLLGGLIVGVIAATHLPLRAQGNGKPQAEPAARGSSARASVQEALLKPYDFRFARPTPLSEVAQRLGGELGAPVVLDLAALDRLEIKPDETVTLELKGVRLKTGLKLLLDQVSLTYRVVAEDNLLVLTDKEGSEDLVEKMSAELHELHRDIHDLQDAVDELRDASGLLTAEGRASASRRSSRRSPTTPRRSRKKVPGRSLLRGPSRLHGPARIPRSSLGPGSDSLEREAIRSMRQGSSSGVDEASGRRAKSPAGEGRNWLTEPRTAVLVVLGGVVLAGGGRRLFQAWNARKAVARLGETDVAPGEVEAVARFGRAGLHELFRIFGEASSAPLREAAGRAIASLWAQDQLIAEEEQALVRRGYAVEWRARRRYPRGLRAEIPIAVTYGLPFLKGDGQGVKPANLEWSHRVTGARRAALEEDSPWTPGAGRVNFSIVPGDFDSNGPHKLVLQTRVRTVGLTDAWQIDLPHVASAFEFDPRLEVGSLLASPDDSRAEQIGRTLRLLAPGETSSQTSQFLALNGELTLRNPPQIALVSPLPCDLAHRIAMEFQGVEGRFDAGRLIVSGQGGRADALEFEGSRPRFNELGPISTISSEAMGQPGRRAMRVILTADPELGWTDPDVRSVWPGSLETGWVDVEIVRR